MPNEKQLRELVVTIRQQQANVQGELNGLICKLETLHANILNICASLHELEVGLGDG